MATRAVSGVRELTRRASSAKCNPPGVHGHGATLRTMRVLVVSTWLPTVSHPSMGSFVVKDARAIADLGHEVALIHLVPPSQLSGHGAWALAGESPTIAGLPVTRIVMSTTSPRQIAAATARLARWSRGADMVHTMAFSTLLPFAAWRPSAPWVHTEHWSGLTAPHLLPPPWRAALPTLKPLLTRPDVATTVCDYLAAPIKKVRGKDPTVVVPCIVPSPGNLSPRRTSPDSIALVSVGGLVAGKDPLMAVKTVAELARRGVDSTLTWVGEGPLRNEVRALADELGVGAQVRLTGTLDRPAVLAELARSDVFIGPTLSDNFFVSCAEALRSGRPVVVGATGGHTEYISDRVGICVVTRTPEAYADAVLAVAELTQGLSAREISDTIGDQFEVSTVANAYDDAYALAAQQPRRGARLRAYRRAQRSEA